MARAALAAGAAGDRAASTSSTRPRSRSRRRARRSSSPCTTSRSCTSPSISPGTDADSSRRGLSLARSSADVVLVPSQSTFDDCVEAEFDRREVATGAARRRRCRRYLTRQVAAFVAAHDLPKRYVLWCGTLEPRKNVPTLLRAFASVRRTDPELGLVLVGPTGWGDVDGGADVAEGVQLLGFLADRRPARGLRRRDARSATRACARASGYRCLRRWRTACRS